MPKRFRNPRFPTQLISIMPRLIILILILVSFSIFAAGQTFYGTTELATFREGRDKEFRDKAESPLLESDFEDFKGLNYFPVNRKFRVKAVFERTNDQKYFQIPTSSGIAKKFLKYGILSFNLGGQKQRLNVYQIEAEILLKFPEYADLLFIPFKDRTSGKETYGVGRYIDIKTPTGKTVILDFNLAYNPNCAYGSEKYSCPIPPKDNVLKVEIRAGERKFAVRKVH